MKIERTRRRFKSVSLSVPVILGLILGTCCAPSCSAYSVLTHEAIIDAAWKDSIVPTLLERFPDATPEQLLEAHAYAYGGAIIQDMGYYPFGSRFFSDLTHYVRSGDFVLALIEESSDLNEYAFALGALAHYAADDSGHPLATNRAVAMLYPQLEKKYGFVVTYEEKPSAHMKVEFGFDVDQVAEGNYAPKAYHDFIGFEVSKPVLERAFARTYSFEMSSVFFGVDMAIGSYRHAVSSVIPHTTKVAWHLKRREIQNSDHSETKKNSSTTFQILATAKSGAPITRSRVSSRASWRSFSSCCPKLARSAPSRFIHPHPLSNRSICTASTRLWTIIDCCCLPRRKADSNCPTITSTPVAQPYQPCIG